MPDRFGGCLALGRSHCRGPCLVRAGRWTTVGFVAAHGGEHVGVTSRSCSPQAVVCLRRPELRSTRQRPMVTPMIPGRKTVSAVKAAKVVSSLIRPPV